MNSVFFINSVVLGVGLAMDAFSVSLENGHNEPQMSKGKIVCVAGVFAFFQAFMPIISWLCVHGAVLYFRAFHFLIPWAAVFLLLYIGIKMLIDGICIRSKDEGKKLTAQTLFIQGTLTSIDALSAGFAIADYNALTVLETVFIIASVTFVICTAGLLIGKRFGTKLSNKAQIFGGFLLIIIGLEIFVIRIM